MLVPILSLRCLLLVFSLLVAARIETKSRHRSKTWLTHRAGRGVGLRVCSWWPSGSNSLLFTAIAFVLNEITLVPHTEQSAPAGRHERSSASGPVLNSVTHSLSHSLTYSLTHSLTPSLTRSLTHTAKWVKTAGRVKTAIAIGLE